MFKNLWAKIAFLWDFLYVSVVCATAITIEIVLLQMIMFGNFYKTFQENPMSFLDFVEYYVFTFITYSSEAHLIYHPDVQLRVMSQLTGATQLQKSFFAEYMPYTGVVLYPLSLFPIDIACIVWLMFLSVSAFTAVVWAARRFGSCSLPSALAIAMAVFASIPGCRASFFGQLNWLMIPLVALMLWTLLEKRDYVGGVVLSILSLKPHYALAFLLPALAWRRWRLLAVFCLCVLALTVVAGQLIGWSNVLDYPHILIELQTKLSYMGSDYKTDRMFSIGMPRLIVAVLPDSQRMLAIAIVWLAGLLTIFWVWHKSYLKGRLMSCWAVAISSLVLLIVSPHSHYHDAVLLSLAAVLTIESVSLRRLGSASTVELKLWTIILLLYPLLTWFVRLVWKDNLCNLSYLVIHLLLLFIGMRQFRKVYLETNLNPAS